jgi:hypothetical protein
MEKDYKTIEFILDNIQTIYEVPIVVPLEEKFVAILLDKINTNENLNIVIRNHTLGYLFSIKQNFRVKFKVIYNKLNMDFKPLAVTNLDFKVPEAYENKIIKLYYPILIERVPLPRAARISLRF